jgi:hypothetical protein
MKISRKNMDKLSTELGRLVALADDVKEHAEDWTERVDSFESYKYDAEWQRQEINFSRERLEDSLEHLTVFLAWFFDFLHAERRALELETGKYLQSIGNDRIEKGVQESGA